MPDTSYPLLEFVSPNETTIRLSAFIGLWKIPAPRRAPAISKLLIAQ